jgi:hypothetical protein
MQIPSKPKARTWAAFPVDPYFIGHKEYELEKVRLLQEAREVCALLNRMPAEPVATAKAQAPVVQRRRRPRWKARVYTRPLPLRLLSRLLSLQN